MTDLSGITVVTGVLHPQRKEALAAALDRIGGKLVDSVRLDTTHFVCSEGRGPLWEKAVQLNIPVVVPEWVDACEAEGTITARAYFWLDTAPADHILNNFTYASISIAVLVTPANSRKGSDYP
ncbi:hypothetical protein COL922a_014565 [Colletotrichum nupharicola]|nr:hypothetical protein COL922a_014565 [Colletotrichum nupharicola]